MYPPFSSFAWNTSIIDAKRWRLLTHSSAELDTTMAPRSRTVQEEESTSLAEPLLAPPPRPQGISRNVPLALAYTAFIFAGRSVWSQSVLSTYVFLLRHHDYRAVGIITAAMGLAQLVTSFPSGYLADRYRRDVLLRVASVVASGAIASTLYAIWHNHYHALVLGLSVWGSYWGISNTALSAIFADSIPTGQRSYYFTQRSLLVNLGFATGPVVSLILFAVLGDEWKIRDCAVVLAAGQAVCLPALVLLWFLSDDHIVEANEATNQSGGNTTENAPPAEESNTENDALVEVLPPHALNESPINDNPRWGCLHSGRRVAIMIATADLFSGLASGMSIRYFPIFFVENLRMGPVLVQVLYMLSPLFIAVCMQMSQYLSTRHGRCRVSVAFKWIGIALMYTLVVIYRAETTRWLVATIYIVRTAFINSTGALTRSVLMDHVPPSERGRWAALESLNMFSWSGSAALGGYLVGYIGMIPLFCTTAAIQFLATMPLVVLSWDEKLEGASPNVEEENARLITDAPVEQDTVERDENPSIASV